MRKLGSAAFLAVATLFLVGCGGASPGAPIAKTTGTVTYKGEAVEGAIVTMVSKDGKYTSSGTTDSSGKFEMKTAVGPKSFDGAPIGEVFVGIKATTSAGTSEMTPEDMMKMAQDGKTEPESKIPEKYANPKKSGLDKTISKTAADNNFDFALED